MQATPTEASIEAPIEAPIVKKTRSSAQMAALEAARKKAFELRAAKAKAKATPTEAPTEAPVKATEAIEAIEEDPKEEVQYVRRPKAKKPKRVIVVQEESSSDSEIEIHWDKPKRTDAPSKDPKYDRAYSQMFYVSYIMAEPETFTNYFIETEILGIACPSWTKKYTPCLLSSVRVG